MSADARREAIDTLCVECGGSLPLDQPAGERRCLPCFDRYLRGIDNEFLDNYARLGARGRIVVAEACLRELVVSDLGDRRLLAMTIYEQFVGVATDLLALYHALLERERTPITRGVLRFDLDVARTVDFFARLGLGGAAEMLYAVGLPHPDQLPLLPGDLDARERKQVRAALWEALSDFARLDAYRTVGEQALVSAAARLGSPRALVDGTAWLAGRSLEPGHVAALALTATGRALEINVLNTDEETLGNVVDGIDIMTRLIRNLIFAYVSLQTGG